VTGAEHAKPTKVGLLLAVGPIVEICWNESTLLVPFLISLPHGLFLLSFCACFVHCDTSPHPYLLDPFSTLTRPRTSSSGHLFFSPFSPLSTYPYSFQSTFDPLYKAFFLYQLHQRCLPSYTSRTPHQNTSPDESSPLGLKRASASPSP
jgi:hypothetical protein